MSEREPDRRAPYRMGRKNRHTFYEVNPARDTTHLADYPIGCVFDPGRTIFVVAALNDFFGDDWRAKYGISE